MPMSVLHIHVHVHVACPCSCPICMSMFNLYDHFHSAYPYPWCMSMSMSMSMIHVHVHGACPIHAECPCQSCMSISMLHVVAILHVHVNGAWPPCHGVCPCPRLCCMSNSMLHVHVCKRMPKNSHHRYPFEINTWKPAGVVSFQVVLVVCFIFLFRRHIYLITMIHPHILQNLAIYPLVDIKFLNNFYRWRSVMFYNMNAHGVLTHAVHIHLAPAHDAHDPKVMHTCAQPHANAVHSMFLLKN